MKIYSLYLCLLISTFLSAQTEFSVMCFNTLIYPQGDIPNRADTLEKIFDHILPDLLLLQELKSEEGLEAILDVCNSFPNTAFASGTYVPQISNPSNDWRLQQNIIFNTHVFGLADEFVIETIYRDINYFKLYLFDTELANGADTTFLHVYNTHLKSSQGQSNEQLRLAMAEVINESVNLLPANSLIIVGGDFNVYTSDEPAYQLLLQENVVNPLFDPIDMPGNWTDFSFPNKEILTQSTRASNIGDGAGGGMDDRFDFILLSEALMNAGSELHYIADSYNALGNNGTCYNSSITACLDNNPVPINVLRALFYMSDHLPVVLKLNTSITLSNEKQEMVNIRVYPNPAQNFLRISTDHIRPSFLRIFDQTGRLLSEEKTIDEINISHLSSGVYFIEFHFENELISHLRFLKTSF